MNPYESPAEISELDDRAARLAEPRELPFRSAETLTRILLGFYIALLVLNAVAVIEIEVGRYFTMQVDRVTAERDPLADEEQTERRLVQLRRGYLVSWYVNAGRVTVTYILQLVTAAAFLVWLYTVNGNLPALGCERIFRQWPAVLAMLIPCVNILLSLPVMHELAAGSDPRRLNPHGYRGGRFRLLVICWWLFMVLALLCWISLVATMTDRYAQPSLPNILRSQSIISALQLIPLALGYLLIRNIWRDQQLRRDLVLNNAPLT